MLAASASSAPAAAPAAWTDLARAIAAPWPDLQGANGHFRDYVLERVPARGRDDYGDALLGYGLLQVGVRDGDRRAIESGLRALTRVANAGGLSEAVSMFTFAGLAAGYNLAREQLANEPLFVNNRRSWEERLKRVRVLRLGLGRRVTNKSLVEAVAVLELVRTGLRSNVPGSVLSDPATATRLAERLLSRDLPAAARRYERGGRALIGDFPDLPLPYHALAVGFLGRAVDLLGSRAPSAARDTLDRAARASLALAAPDGDVGYAGRSQEQSWTLPLTAYGVELAGRTALARAADYRALAERAIGRLGAAYGIGPEGLFVTPALQIALDAGIAGLDEYVAAASYNGLTLMALNWAIEAASGPAPGAGSIGADRSGSAVVGRGPASLATVRAGDVWFAVKQGPEAGHDMRGDFGLLAFKARRADGSWEDVLRPLPRRKRDSAGPVLRTSAGNGLPVGRSLAVSGAAVTVRSDLRTPKRKVLRRAVAFQFRPAGCGVRIEFPSAQLRWEWSAFFPGTAGGPTADDARVFDAGREVTFEPRGAVSFQSGYASGVDPRLVRARVRLGRGAATSISICPR